MSWWTQAAGGLRALWRRRRTKHELDEELRSFLAAAVAEKVRSGMSEPAAWREARREHGSLDAVKEAVWAAGWEARIATVGQDLRHGARTLARGPSRPNVLESGSWG